MYSSRQSCTPLHGWIGYTDLTAVQNCAVRMSPLTTPLSSPSSVKFSVASWSGSQAAYLRGVRRLSGPVDAEQPIVYVSIGSRPSVLTRTRGGHVRTINFRPPSRDDAPTRPP